MNVDRIFPTDVLQCTHGNTIIKPLPPGGQHHAELRCANCGTFIRWLPKPPNVERRKLNGYKLAKLQMHPGLNPWEREFTDSLARQGNKLSPKQQAVFDRLCFTYLKGGAQNEG